jgi:hypothetical protein
MKTLTLVVTWWVITLSSSFLKKYFQLCMIEHHFFQVPLIWGLCVFFIHETIFRLALCLMFWSNSLKLGNQSISCMLVQREYHHKSPCSIFQGLWTHIQEKTHPHPPSVHWQFARNRCRIDRSCITCSSQYDPTSNSQLPSGKGPKHLPPTNKGPISIKVWITSEKLSHIQAWGFWGGWGSIKEKHTHSLSLSHPCVSKAYNPFVFF